MDRSKKAWINGLFIIVTLIVNGLGAFGVINGLSQKDISDKYVTLITPAPSTFSIWSVIYTLLIVSIIVMIVKSDDSYYGKAIDKITGLFRISCLLNIIWIVTFSYLQIALSTIFILAFAIVLSIICLKLIEIDDGKHFLLPLTFGMYTGWLIIATVVNVAAALVKANWNGFGIAPEIWAVGILMVAIVIVLIVIRSIRNAIFPLPIAWGYYGIYKFLKSPDGFNGQFTSLQTVALVGVALLVMISAYQLYKNKYSIIPKHLERS